LQLELKIAGNFFNVGKPGGKIRLIHKQCQNITFIHWIGAFYENTAPFIFSTSRSYTKTEVYNIAVAMDSL